MMRQVSFLLLFIASVFTEISAHTLFSSQFRDNAEGFVYNDNAFRNTTQGLYASGKYNIINNGYLDVILGGIDHKTIYGMSGGWVRDFTLPQAADVVIKINYDLYMSSTYEQDEYAEVLCSVDGILFDNIGKTYGTRPGISPVWVTVKAGVLKAGQHRLTIGAYNNKKTTSSEQTVARFGYVILDYVPVTTSLPVKPPTKAPTRKPTKAPTKAPTRKPTKAPTKAPVRAPTKAPVRAPTKAPTKRPTKAPTKVPVKAATKTPTKAPTKVPVKATTKTPTKRPTTAPIKAATKAPTKHPTKAPTMRPTKAPISKAPTNAPTKVPTTFSPTTAPTVAPSKTPTKAPTKVLTISPTATPTLAPSQTPTKAPTKVLTISPTKAPTIAPSKVPTTPASDDKFVRRINAGSAYAYVDPDGATWEADKYFEGRGSMYSQCPMEIANTEADGLYCKERYYNIWGEPQPYNYVIPVPAPGAYSVKLHFAEIYHTVKGKRVFRVKVNGITVVSQLDIVDQAGPNAALIIPATTVVKGSTVTIELVPLAGDPKICAIEVMEATGYVEPPTSAPVALPFSVRINCGGSSFVEAVGGRTWSDDQYFTGGSPYTDGSYPIQNSLDANLYQTERYGEFRYDIPVPTNGNYEVILHFAELYWGGIGERVFNVNVEGTAIFDNVDIVALGNGKKLQAVTLESLVTVTDGLVSIQLSNSNPRIDNPKLSGIEIAVKP